MNQDVDVTLNWCTDSTEAPKLGNFFANNITPEYISHSELQGSRALDVHKWSPDLLKTLTEEIADRTEQMKGISSTAETRPVFAARRGEQLVALGMVSFFPAAQVPYAILEDVVVAANSRDHGIGAQVVEWLATQAKSVGCKRLFLESGLQN